MMHPAGLGPVPKTALSESLLRFPMLVNGDSKTLVPPS